MANPITSDELNYLVFRYLAESGFQHTAFMFGHESGVDNSTIDGIQPGALVKVIVKGLQQIAMEANMGNGEDEDGDFIILEPLELITKEIAELRKMVKDKKKSNHGAADKKKSKRGAAEQQLRKETEGASSRKKDKAIADPEKPGTQAEGKAAVGKHSQRRGKRKIQFAP